MLLITYFNSEKWCVCPSTEVLVVAEVELASPNTMISSLNVFWNSNVTLFATELVSSSFWQEIIVNKAINIIIEFINFFHVICFFYFKNLFLMM